MKFKIIKDIIYFERMFKTVVITIILLTFVFHIYLGLQVLPVALKELFCIKSNTKP